MSSSSPEYSVFVSNVVDVIGCSPDNIRQRKRISSDLENEFNNDNKDEVKMIISGSKSEGITSFFESDIDAMVETGDAICTRDVSKYVHIPSMTICRPIREYAAPGYTFLELFRDGQNILLTGCTNWDVDCFVPNIIPKEKFRISYMGNDPYYGEVSPMEGPSLPVKVDHLHFDAVPAFKCEFPDTIQRFMTRDRKFNQPDKDTLKEAANLDSHVVAVGSKCGDRPDLEWRISYTEAEKHLLGCLNETEIKLCVMLKLLAKSNFDGIKSVSSYTLKNIVLWMSELYPRNTFLPELLVPRLLDALKLLRHCVRHRYLPNYMIPERNLFSGRLKQPEYIKLLHKLSAMIEEGGNVLLMCPRLKEAMMTMYESPAKAHRLGNIRDVVEHWWFAKQLIKSDLDLDDEVGVWIKSACGKDYQDFKENKISRDVFQSRLYLSLQKMMV